MTITDTLHEALQTPLGAPQAQLAEQLLKQKLFRTNGGREKLKAHFMPNTLLPLIITAFEIMKN
jgi:hypothetical protein